VQTKGSKPLDERWLKGKTNMNLGSLVPIPQ
jgi:hypothetical protein